jgi:hypothetical protein
LYASALFANPKQASARPARPYTEFLERLPPCNRLGQTFGQFIEFVVHTFPFDLLLFAFCTTRISPVKTPLVLPVPW